jgi:hypothetical protein
MQEAAAERLMRRHARPPGRALRSRHDAAIGHVRQVGVEPLLPQHALDDLALGRAAEADGKLLQLLRGHAAVALDHVLDERVLAAGGRGFAAGAGIGGVSREAAAIRLAGVAIGVRERRRNRDRLAASAGLHLADVARNRGPVISWQQRHSSPLGACLVNPYSTNA